MEAKSDSQQSPIHQSAPPAHFQPITSNAVQLQPSPYFYPSINSPVQQHPSTVVVHPGRPAPQQRDGCCCGACCHVTTCVLILATIELFCLVTALIASCVVYQEYVSSYSLYTAISLAVCVTYFLTGVPCIVALVFGILKERALLLIPHMVFQTVSLVGAVAVIIFCSLDLMIGASWKWEDRCTERVVDGHIDVHCGEFREPQMPEAITIQSLILLFTPVAIGIEIGFLVQVAKTYSYLKRVATPYIRVM